MKNTRMVMAWSALIAFLAESRTIHFLLLACVMALATDGFSQAVEYVGIENGLSNNNINTIYKDRFGFMWFGTENGLNRFDGHEVKVFRNSYNDTTSLIQNHVSILAEDSQGTLFIGTRKGLNTLDNFSFHFQPTYYFPFHSKAKKKIVASIYDIKTTKQGQIGVATQGLGLLWYDATLHAFRQIPAPAPAQPLSYNVTSLQVDSNGVVWFVIQNQGLYTYHPQQGKVQFMSASIHHGLCMKFDAHHNLWIGSDIGLYHYNTRENTLQFYDARPNQLTHCRVLGLEFDNPDQLWIGTAAGGINILNLKTNRMDYTYAFNHSKILSSYTISTLYKDSESRWWIGTLRGGITILDRNKNNFRTIAPNPLSTISIVSSFFEDTDGALWIGTDGGGLSVWNRKKNAYQSFVNEPVNPGSISNNTITSICRDGKNNIWLATYGGGINKFNRATKTFQRYASSQKGFINALFRDSDQILWAATGSNDYLFRLNEKTDQFDVFDPQLLNIQTLAEDKAKNLWVGTLTHLIRIDKVGKKHTFFPINSPIRALHEDRRGNFWIATSDFGLLKFNRQTGAFIAFTEKDGLANNSVLTIQEDQAGNLWLTTLNGLSRFNPARGEWKNFYESDGLQSNQFTNNAALRLENGEMVIGGIKGFTMFNPDRMHFNAAFPNLVLTGLKIANTPITQASITVDTTKSLYETDAITVPYNQAFISFDFSAIEYATPDKIKFAYVLAGWETVWHYVGNQRTATYSNLKEGDYTLRIKSTNANGAWNPQERLVRVKILPPWYRSWWAYVVYGACLMAMVYAYTYYQRKQTRLQYQIDIAAIEATKDKELHERKLAFFTNISHEFRTPLTLIINPVKGLLSRKQDRSDAHELTVIHRNARRLLRLIDQLLLFRKVESEEGTLTLRSFNLTQACQDVYLCFGRQAEVKNIRYEFDQGPQPIDICADQEKVEIILFNLLSNAFKFTPEYGTITLQLRQVDQVVELCVADSGCGIPPTVGDRLFDRFYQISDQQAGKVSGFGIGLYLVHTFIHLHKGQIRYESQLGQGTLFRVQLPNSLEAADPQLSKDILLSEVARPSVFTEERMEEMTLEEDAHLLAEEPPAEPDPEQVVSGKRLLLLVEDNLEIRDYLRQLFTPSFRVQEAGNGEEGYALARKYSPDIIISDILMQGMNGLELCQKIKENPALNHIPVILLTASSSPEVKLQGISGGADDYITKPFDQELLVAKVESLLKRQTTLQQYFYNEITLKPNHLKISEEYSAFLSTCIATIEASLDDPTFTMKTFAKAMGMSHSTLYKKVKAISGRSITDFVRFIRLRKAAKLLIDTECNVNEAAAQAGFNTKRYFRDQFQKLYGIPPSEYMKKYRQSLIKHYRLNEEVVKKT